jgi:hypothetical protein
VYPKQPFDVAGRTGTVVFDVSADSAGGHAAWPEFWWTDQPVPAPHGHQSAMDPYAQNSFGFSLAQTDWPCAGGQVGVDTMLVTRQGHLESLDFTNVACVDKGSAGALNHFEVRIGQQRVEVWGADPGSTAVRLLAYADQANLPLTRGVIWLEDVHYNACKFDDQCDHQFVWDNVGFDGPALYRDLTFDVPDANVAAPSGGQVQLGYQIGPNPTALTTLPVYWLQQPTKALVMFNWFADDTVVPDVRVNGGPWHNTKWTFDDSTYSWRTIAIEVPFDEVHQGPNTLEFRTTNQITIANIDLALIAASPVPST